MLNEECVAIHWQEHHGLPPGYPDKSKRRFMVYQST